MSMLADIEEPRARSRSDAGRRALTLFSDPDKPGHGSPFEPRGNARYGGGRSIQPTWSCRYWLMVYDLATRPMEDL